MLPFHRQSCDARYAVNLRHVLAYLKMSSHMHGLSCVAVYHHKSQGRWPHMIPVPCMCVQIPSHMQASLPVCKTGQARACECKY